MNARILFALFFQATLLNIFSLEHTNDCYSTKRTSTENNLISFNVTSRILHKFTKSHTNLIIFPIATSSKNLKISEFVITLLLENYTSDLLFEAVASLHREVWHLHRADPSILIRVVLILFECYKSYNNSTSSGSVDKIDSTDVSSYSDEFLTVLLRIRNVRYMRLPCNTSTQSAYQSSLQCRHKKARPALFHWVFISTGNVRSGSLLEIHRTLVLHRRDGQSTGIVGGIIHAHTRTLSAGSIVFRDGCVLRYGAGRVPSDYRLSFVRSVDCVDARLFAVHGRLLNGHSTILSTSFSSPDYSLLDLCFQAQSRGFAVVYSPFIALNVSDNVQSTSTCSHNLPAQPIQGDSSSTSDAKLLIGRWLNFTQHRPIYSPDREQHLAYCMRSREVGRRVLFIDDGVFAASAGAGFGRAREIWKTVAGLGHHVLVFPSENPYKLEDLAELQLAGIEVKYPFPREKINKYYFGKFVMDHLQGYLDAVVISRPHNFIRIFMGLRSTLLAMNPQMQLVYDFEGLYHTQQSAFADYANSSKERDNAHYLWDLERYIVRNAKLFITVSETEKKGVIDIADSQQIRLPASNVFVLSHAIHKLRPEEQLQLQLQRGGRRRTILFMGTFGNATFYNGDAVIHFVQRILPLIETSFPSGHIRFLVAGSRPPTAVQLLARVTTSMQLLGFVHNLSALFASADVFVIPHPYSSGIPIKAFDAALFGVPVVLSAAVNKSFGVGASDGMLVADNDTHFAGTVVSLLKNELLWRSMHEGTKRFVEQHDVNTFQLGLKAILDRVPSISCRF